MQIMLLPPLSVAFLYNKVHIFHTLTVFVAGSDNINSSGVYATVTDDICEFGNVLFDTVKGTGK